MKRSVIGFIIISVVGLFTEQIWAHDGGGASGGGFFGHLLIVRQCPLSLDPDRA
jgi:hypothetical protein